MIIGIETHRGRIFINTDNLVLLDNTNSIISQGVEFLLTYDDFADLKTYMELTSENLKVFKLETKKTKKKK